MFKIIKYLREVKYSALAIILLLIVQAYCELSLPAFTADIIDIGIMQGGVENGGVSAGGADWNVQLNYLLTTGAKMLGMTLAMLACAVVVGLLASRAGALIGKNLRERIFCKVVSFSHTEIDQFSTASLITRSTNDIQQIQMVSIMLLRMVAYAPIMGIGGIIKVAGTKTGMDWIIVIAVGAIMILVVALMKIALPKFKIVQTLIDRLNLVSREILTGIPVIRAFSREDHEKKRFEAANRDLMKTQLFTNRVMTFMMPAMMLIMNGITVLIVWAGAKGVDLGRLQVGDMMAFITYTMQIVMSFLMLTMISIMLPRAGVAADRIDEVLHTDVSIQDKKEVMDDILKEPKGEVTFEGVSFRYPNADEDALSEISFTAGPGKVTAIIGSTGCGKSTLLHLILRFYDVTKGRILIDGVDIRELSQKKLHSLLGFVPQKGVLFSGTIASNIKFGGRGIEEDTVKKAAKIAQATEFIAQKKGQYDSEIAQGGSNVSGGQKQRLSIARAIAVNPKIYLFDDSFSALDYKTDSALRKALNEETKEATVIIVAQRISTILQADQILVLEDGRIVGKGTHKELLDSCEEYLEIAKSQLSEAELKGGKAG
ncbi:MAG: ABC transporter ATP-binding protein [Lachnospiraceae bacterium]